MDNVVPFLPKESPEYVSLRVANADHKLLEIDADFRIMTIYGDGKVLVRINMKSGEAQLVGDLNEAAAAFWRAVGAICPLKG